MKKLEIEDIIMIIFVINISVLTLGMMLVIIAYLFGGLQ